MRRLVLLLAVLAIGAAGTAVAAEPSLIGPTGLLLIPTADTVGTLRWNAGASNIWTDGGPDESFLFANIGLLPGLEVGATREELEDDGAETLLNAKYRFLGLPGRVEVAAGVIDLTDEFERSAYAVLSHELGAGVVSPHGQFTMPRLHVGVGGGQFDGLFGGVSVVVGGKADVMAEYDGEDFNLGVRWPVLPKVSLTAGTLRSFDDFALEASVSSPW